MNTINKSLKEAIEAKIGTAIPMLNSRDLQVKASAVVPPAYLDAIDSHDRWSERFKKQCEEVVEQHKDVLDFEDKDRIEGNKPVIAEEPVKIKDQKITESLKENYQDFVFTVKCNDGPKEIVRVVAEDRSKAEEYAKNMYSQNHTTYADDRNNVWTIEEGNQLKEALHGMNEIDQFVKMANAIGLKTMGDVKNFLDREGDGKDILTALYDYLYHEIGDLEFQVEDESLKESYLDNIKNPDYWQHQVDYQIEKFGRVGGGLIQDLDEAGFYLDAKDKVTSKGKNESLTEGLERSFVELPTFKADWKRLGLDDEDLRDLQNAILNSPEQGIPLGSNAFKIRFKPKDTNHGKNTSHRAIYVDVIKESKIYLTNAFSKADEANLTSEELKAVRAFAKEMNS